MLFVMNSGYETYSTVCLWAVLIRGQYVALAVDFKNDNVKIFDFLFQN